MSRASRRRLKKKTIVRDKKNNWKIKLSFLRAKGK